MPSDQDSRSKTLIARRYVLEGRVQQVGCRAQVLEVVLAIGNISGFVRNLVDGRVEVYAKGPAWRMQDLEKVLREQLQAPVKIERVLSEELPALLVPNGFVIRRD